MNPIPPSSRRSARPLRTIAAASLVAAVACAAVLVATRRVPAEPVRAGNAVGDVACLSCHREKASFEVTAHRLTSQLPTSASIHGSFSPGANVLRTSNPHLHFDMDSTAAGFYQAAITGSAPDTSIRSERFAYVIGSGRKGQSYLYWQGNRLYQLPVSYWTGLGTWINSPGYQDGRANFDRPVAPRCLECHASGFESVPDLTASNAYRPATAMLGITCETCHGSGQAHVTRERSALRPVLRAVVSPAIVNPARLPRARQLDGCALCHGGVGRMKSDAFSYVPGQPLAAHLDLPIPPLTQQVDVHGNQVALLERSACFRSSQMTCATCHNVHQQQRDVVALSGRCLSCHTVQSCGLYPQRGQALIGHCVDCHMPALPSNTIVSSYNGRKEQPLVRTHWIKVYPLATSP